MAERPKDRAAVALIDDCVEQANAVRKEYEPQWYENWGNYRVESTHGGNYPNKSFPYADSGAGRGGNISPVNFLKTPESHQGVNTIRALLLAGLFGVRDYVQADPVGDEDIEAAKRVSRLVMFGLERPGNFRTNFENIGDGLIFGLGSYSGRWRHDTRLVPRRFPVPDPTGQDQFLKDPETGAILSVLRNVEVPVFDDPVIEPDDLFNTWFDPSANRFDQLKYKITRFKIRNEELDTLKDDEHWDKEGITEVLLVPPTQTESGPERDDHPKLLTENLTREDTKDVAKYGYYGGWKFEGTIPKEVADKIGGIDHRGTVIIKIVNGYIIQAIQSPERDGHIQGGTLTILPTGRGIYGLSPLTIVRYLQDVSDTQLILTTQALIESVYQNYLVGGDQGPNFARDLETRRPREVFTLQGDIDQLQPLPKDYTGLQISVGALNLISQTIRGAMNARDPVQGITKQTGDTTATETQIVTQAALQNTDQLAVLIERDELPVMGRLINNLYYVNLEDEAKVFRRVGEENTTKVNYFDIDMVTDINFVGARNVLTKGQKANQMRDFLQLILSHPLTAAALDIHEYARRFGDEAMDVRGLEKLMITDPEEIVSRLQAMGLANTVAPTSPQASQGRSTGGGSSATTATQAAGETS